ncbi:FG-GAP repeat domain-containing protein [Anaerotignum propionicum]|uniref:Repeat domain-containing protein n=1 Tax=Anaerotignum propionicum DSM 1682 TaxID=991789 RepID=A0A110A6W1_ANAPI|nr:VCBS repeat-containing protein [Anaerotignum propionicum]AMJ39698.1 hypothetical protein CPRO_00740 [Anaerotignum propionicum DSM 1682]SHE30066.1 Repeat domain-containing protein [[Clostridium] propionicum DSM 1682] [Anaerotignum propionicum DSM 1682]
MKKAIMLLIGVCLFCMTGCSGKDGDQSISLSPAEQEAYVAQIDAVMDEFYWSYDKDSLSFHGGEIPQDTKENARLFNASQDAGYPLKSVVGSQSVVATAELLHYNGDTAGEVNCIFVSNHLAGVYYIGGYDEEEYSLRERNPFLANGDFTAYENWTGINSGYRELSGSLPADGFVAKNRSGVVASIQDGKVELYHLSGRVISRMRKINPAKGVEAVSAVFLENGKEDMLVVLWAEMAEEAIEGEGEINRAEKIVFYDSKLQPVTEVPLESGGATALGSEKGKLFLFTGQAMETYESGGEGWHKTQRESLRHRVTQCHIADLDGDGTAEFLMTDGMDLYMYHHLETGLLKLWSTHLGVESLYGALYSGDLNGDGVKEVYICDATGTAIRYILTERGLRSSNEDIQYGQAIYPCDWNGDGIDDYWNVTEDVTRTGKLFLSKPAS